MAAQTVNIAGVLKGLNPESHKPHDAIKAAIARARTEAIANAIGKAA